MPWTPLSAHAHTHKANTPHAKAVWSKISNSVLAKSGDEGKAIRIANAAVAKLKHK